MPGACHFDGHPRRCRKKSCIKRRRLDKKPKKEPIEAESSADEQQQQETESEAEEKEYIKLKVKGEKTIKYEVSGDTIPIARFEDCIKWCHEDEKYVDDLEEDEKYVDVEEDDEEDDDCREESSVPISKEAEPIEFDEEAAKKLEKEYEHYSRKKWANIDVLRQHLIDTDLSDLCGRHPNSQFIYESQKSRGYLLGWLFESLKSIGQRSIFDRDSWENIEYLPGGPLFVSKETLLKPKKTRIMKEDSIVIMKVAVEAVITLLYWNLYSTKRDIYYQHFKRLNVTQRRSDELLDDIACNLHVPRASIHVIASSKGLIHGDVCLYIHNGKRHIPEGTSIEKIKSDGWNNDHKESDISKICCRNSEVSVPNKVFKIIDIESKAKFLLVVEKEATYHTLIEAGFAEKWNCIIITAKGYPDVNTRHLVRLIWTFLKIPVFALVDGDPFGFDVYCSYKYGSINMAFDSANLTCPNMKLIGLRPSDFPTYRFNEHSYYPLSRRDINKLNEIRQRPYADMDEDLHSELHLFEKYQKKLELQALNVIAINYLPNEFLPKKIVTGRFDNQCLFN